MDLRENYNRLKGEAYSGLMKRSSSKNWVRMLEAAPYFVGNMTRGRLLQAVNVGMRILDDIADGDRPPPEGFSPVAYLEKKQEFIHEPNTPVDDLDYLFTYCYQLADKSGLRIGRELDAFFDYFLFDARRRGTGAIFTQAELDRAYDACDITGTIRGSLMVFGDDPNRADSLMPLGKATRKYYTLRDYEADIAAGFVNIPREAVDSYGITTDVLTDRFTPSVSAWFQSEARSGLDLLQEQERILARERFQWRGRVALHFAYSKPTRRYLEGVLMGKNLEPN
jgi:hypothetical protein